MLLGAVATAFLAWMWLPGTAIDRVAFTAVARGFANPPFFIAGNGSHASPWKLRTFAAKNLTDKRQAPVIVSLGDDPDGFFQSSPPSPIDLAVILSNFQRLGAHQAATAVVLAWESPDPIGLAALDKALSRFDSLVMAAPLARGAVPEQIPPAFRKASVPLETLRGDPSAHTTLVSIHELMDRLPDHVIDVMFQARFRTAVDASFLDGRANELGPARPLITGTRSEPTFVFDADLTVGIDSEADDVLVRLRDLIEEIKTSVVLEPGDLLVVDNNIAVHGRSPFTARFDGYDRWLQRSFVVTDLAPSAGQRVGRVITTQFGS